MPDGNRFHTGQCGLRRRFGGTEDPVEPDSLRSLGHGEHAAHGTQPTVECELAHDCVPAQRCRIDLAGGSKDGKRD